jgi:hypothetical protein
MMALVGTPYSETVQNMLEQAQNFWLNILVAALMFDSPIEQLALEI